MMIKFSFFSHYFVQCIRNSNLECTLVHLRLIPNVCLTVNEIDESKLSWRINLFNFYFTYTFFFCLVILMPTVSEVRMFKFVNYNYLSEEKRRNLRKGDEKKYTKHFQMH